MNADARTQRRARTLDDPRFERLRNPRARRRLVAAMVGLLAVELALCAALDVAPLPAAAGLAVVLLVFVVLLGTLKATTRGVEELPEHALDERQAQLRGRAYARAYRIGATLVVAGAALTVLWVGADLPVPGRGLLLGVLLLAVHIAIVLPTLVAAGEDV